MSEERWTAVDEYVTRLYVSGEPHIDQSDLPEIAVSPPQGKLLYLLALSCRATRILEIGTLAGYSAIWMARALPPDGQLISLEYDPHHAEVARGNIDRAGLTARVEVQVGAALETLPALEGPFDFIFIDADKENYPAYFRAALTLSRPGTTIVADNVVRDGHILDPNHPDPRVTAMREFHDLVASDTRVDATVLQTVGAKGYDGFTIAVVV